MKLSSALLALVLALPLGAIAWDEVPVGDSPLGDEESSYPVEDTPFTPPPEWRSVLPTDWRSLTRTKSYPQDEPVEPTSTTTRTTIVTITATPTTAAEALTTISRVRTIHLTDPITTFVGTRSCIPQYRLTTMTQFPTTMTSGSTIIVETPVYNWSMDCRIKTGTVVGIISQFTPSVRSGTGTGTGMPTSTANGTFTPGTPTASQTREPESAGGKLRLTQQGLLAMGAMGAAVFAVLF